MKAIGKNVLVEVPKNQERKVGSLILLGRGDHQIHGRVVSVGLGITDERLVKGKLVTAIDDVTDGRTVSETDSVAIVAVHYDAILAVEE